MKPELLAPAGNFEKLKVALHYGADAVYVGLDKLSLRANADNFTREELESAVAYTHSKGKKIYIALNIYFTPEQKALIIDALEFIAKIAPDGIILSDMGTLFLAKEYAPKVAIHMSTQANCTNQYAAKFYESAGVSRVVVARELSVKDIHMMHEEIPTMEIEAFVHGAMCIAYSGRCLLSSYMTTEGLGKKPNDNCQVRSANKGDCSHSCRWEYMLKEKTRENQTFDIEEDNSGTYILSSKDICMIDHLKDLVDSGVSSLKIEGRMKSILYSSSIVRAYRAVLDAICSGKEYSDMQSIYNELNVVSHREFSTGFFFDSPRELGNITTSIEYKRNVRLAGLIMESGENAKVKLYNKITTNDNFELIGPNMKTITIGRIEIIEGNGKLTTEARHTDNVSIRLFDKGNNIIISEAMDILRVESSF